VTRVTSGVEDYYLGGPEAAGEWGGMLARQFGLVGEVDDEGSRRALQSRSPVTGEVLPRSPIGQVRLCAASTSALAGSPRSWSISTPERPLAQQRSGLIEIVAPLVRLSRIDIGRCRDSAAGVGFGDRHDDESPIVGDREGALKRAHGWLGPVVADNDSRSAGAVHHRNVDFGASGCRAGTCNG
jgi:hypothetical protein